MSQVLGQYYATISLSEIFLDTITGLPINGGTIAFYSDASRTTPLPVYTLSGNPPNAEYVQLPNPLSIMNGQVVDDSGRTLAIYYYPYDQFGNIQLYFVEIYNSMGTLQGERQQWPPGVTQEDQPQDINSVTTNQISNSQFVQVLFDVNEGQVISFDAPVTNMEYQVAPGWFILVSSNGAGTITINQTSVEGALDIPTNPSYLFDILMGGANISSAQLVQRLYGNPGIWGTTTSQIGYVAGFIIVSSLDGLSHTIQIQYKPSNGAIPTVILSGSTGPSGYVELSNTVELASSSNTDNSISGYVDIAIILPTVGHFNFSSIQIKGLYSLEQGILYEQETVNRQIDHLFHYYNPLLQFKPIKSYLVGWDFPLNPNLAQTVPGSESGNTSILILDQTILYHSAAVSYSFGLTEDLIITPTATGQFALIQYLDAPSIYEIFNNQLSVNLNLTDISVPANTMGNISLWYTTTSLPPLGSGLSIVAALDSTGHPSAFNGTWIEIERNNLGNAEFLLNNTTSPNTIDISFSGWGVTDLSDAFTNGLYFAIVVGFSSLTASSTIGFQSISMVPGQISTRPAPQTADEVLKECGRYRETSYDVGTAPGTATYIGSKWYPANIFKSSLNTGSVYESVFEIEYKYAKRAHGILTTWSVVTPSVGGGLDIVCRQSASDFPAPTTGSNPQTVALSTDFFPIQASNTSITYANTRTSSVMTFSGLNVFDPSASFNTNLHYFIDASLGVV